MVGQVQYNVGDQYAVPGYLVFTGVPMILVMSIWFGAVAPPQPLIDLLGGEGIARIVYAFGETAVYVLVASIMMTFIAVGRVFTKEQQ
jgi:hypothetical protein